MKSVVSVLLALVVLSFCALAPAAGQKKPATPPPPIDVPAKPMMVAVDAPPQAPPHPPLICSVTELKFGSQATGVESCLQVTVINNSLSAQTITKLFTGDEKHYSIPSPSHQMLPISIQPHSNLTLSVCFKPEKVGEFKTRLVVATPEDSVVVPVDGKGIKPEDVGKLPKTEFSVIKPKKKSHTWTFKYQLITPAKITLQLYDELGALKEVFLNGAFKSEGVYEQTFDGTDKGKKKYPPGKYYVRCQIEEANHGNQQPIRITKEIELE